MRKIVVLSFVTLDGVVQAPGGKGEDPAGGFEFEGWSVPYFDEQLGEEMDRQMSQPFDLLLGKTTYDIFAAYWRTAENGDNPINNARKYLVSDAPVKTDWQNTVQISDNVVAELKKLKHQDGPMIQVHGSGNLIQTLLAHDLVDELWLKIFPVTLGTGKRLFSAGTIPAAYILTSSKVTPSGVIIAAYKRGGDIKLGSFAEVELQ